MQGYLNYRGALTSAMFAVAALCIPIFGAMSASADVFHVYEGESIQDVIDIAADGDEITVHPGRYYEAISFSKDITVQSSDGAEVTVLDGSDDGSDWRPVVACEAGSFEGFTVTRGLSCGGMRLGGNCVVSGCIIAYNDAAEAAGTAGWGGGIVVGQNDSPTIINCIVRCNTAYAADGPGAKGGGAFVYQSATPTFINCLFENNFARPSYWLPETGSSGGGMCILNDVYVTLIGCKFTGNRASHGSGFCGDTVLAVNCVFEGNHNGDSYHNASGGAMITGGASLLVNCTFTGNRSKEGGGLVLHDSPTVANCVFWNNSPDQIMDEGSASITYSCVQGGWPGEGNIGADPLFIAEGRWDDNGTPSDPYDDIWMDGVYELQPGSPCIDAGNNAEVPYDVTTDYAGNPRFVDDPDTDDTGLGDPPIVDMGAYEFQVEDPCPADVNDDEVVDIDDLFDVLAHWGEGAGKYDINDDGVVDIDDVFAVLADWGPCPRKTRR